MKNNNSAMNIRLPQKDKVEFENYCYDKGLKPSDVLRALINQVLVGGIVTGKQIGRAHV